jgi:hypothetical protein
MYILTTDLMTDYDKRQTPPLVREGAHIDRTVTFLNLKLQKNYFWSYAPDGVQHQDRLAD